MSFATDVWYAIPSASVERCRRNLPSWRERGYRVAVLQNQERGDIPADLVVWSDTYPGWSESINVLHREIVPADAPLIVSGGDDMLPDPDHTAQELAAQFFERFPDGFGVMQPHGDEFGFARHYCGSPWLGRAWCRTMYRGRGPMCGLYHHNWGDVELYWVSRCYDALWERPDLTQYHAHFRRVGEDAPAWWQHNVQRHDLRDVRLFIQRSYVRFPGHEPLDAHGRRFDPAPLGADEARLAERHYLYHYADDQRRLDSARHVPDLLADLARRRATPIALYGAGRYLHAIAHAIADPPVEIACVIDDDERLHGGSRWRIPVVSRAEALDMGIAAVLVCSDAHDARMWDACAPLAECGVEIVRAVSATPREKRARCFAAVRRLVDDGAGRIALLGAGRHTREIVRDDADRDLRIDLPPEIACIIDGDERLHGQTLLGLPIIGLDEAIATDVDAIVLSSDTVEPAMWTQTAPARAAGIRVLPLYGHAIEGWAPLEDAEPRSAVAVGSAA